MIKTDANGCKHVICGHGTIATWYETKGNLAKLYVTQDTMIPIGSHVPLTGDEVPEVIFSFCNVNTIDCWIEDLQNIKRELMENN